MPTPPPPDLSRDLNHDGKVDGADDPSRDLDHDGRIDAMDRVEEDINHDHIIDSTDRELETAMPKVGTTLGWNKDGQSWKRPETSQSQQQSLGPKVGH